MATDSRRLTNSKQQPERKFGPFHGGLGVAVWLNEVESDDGTRYFRSVTIAPRRYRDEESGDWKDAKSLRATDLPALILGLQAALDFITHTPLPGSPADERNEADAVAANEGQPVF